MMAKKKHSADHELEKMFGPVGGEEPDPSADDDEDVSDEDHANAMKDAGDAMIAAHREGDGHKAAKAVHVLMDLHREKKRDSKDKPSEPDDDGD
jgi:hypothetical protein